MISDYNVIDTIMFSETLSNIDQKLRTARKESFDSADRIIIKQDIEDRYPYVDSAGTKLIEIQKIINNVDISNCFILLITANQDIQNEIKFVTEFYSVDSTPINFLVVNGSYKKEIIKYNSTACQKLWNHLYVGTDGNINPCCLADHRFILGNINNNTVDEIVNSNKSNQIRQWMKQGYRSIACNSCYLKEDNNIISERVNCDASTQEINIDHLDVRINNICNFKCRMCSEYFSSAIQQETIELYGKEAQLGSEKNLLTRFSSTEKRMFLNKIMPYVNSNLKSIYFAGGEPLITAEHYQILDHLIKIKNVNLKVSYNTNLSTLKYKNFDVIEYWNQFQNVIVGASIDASDHAAEYLRYGTKWNNITKNINLIKKHAPAVRLSITSTVSFLSIENLINLQTKWINEGIFEASGFQVNVLTNPDYLSPAVLPRDHKEKLTKVIEKHINWLGQIKVANQWQNVLKFMNNNDYTYALSNFRERTKVLDQHRSESFIEIFPEFRNLYV